VRLYGTVVGSGAQADERGVVDWLRYLRPKVARCYLKPLPILSIWMRKSLLGYPLLPELLCRKLCHTTVTLSRLGDALPEILNHAGKR